MKFSVPTNGLTVAVGVSYGIGGTVSYLVDLK